MRHADQLEQLNIGEADGETTAASPHRPVGIGRRAGPPEYIASALAIGLLMAIAIAIWRGRAQLTTLPPQIAIHLATIIAALALTPLLLLAAKGDRQHRRMGYLWCGLMVATACAAFFIRTISGGFSAIHIFVVLTLVSVPRLIANARRHQVVRHRIVVLSLVFGAFLVAGGFAFVGQRHLAIWLFG
ncbi:hypothetical protein ABC347_16390 [Sphingomonas sp. 1P06PA]|uniref:DUF2306 domain-containing protein n=1 Tax=Sphingomonas sp. 1P06PA TaxID=554121 RepID=UPI0039A69090